MNEDPVSLVAIFGPTGSGKTALACALADRLPCHLISGDALQVYRDLNAATEKPRGDEARHSWALIDCVEPGVDFNLGDWVRRAEREVRWAWAAGRLPVVAGGTGMYLRGLLKGVAPAPARDERLRERLLARAEGRGVPSLHRLLRRLDPATAARLGPNDRQRLVRALEVRVAAGASLHGLQKGGWEGPDRFAVLRVGLELPRPLLYERINRRVTGYLTSGLVAEVRWLLEERRVPRDANAFRALGYRETLRWFLGGPGGGERQELEAEIQTNTRHYAKRQVTWFRREPATLWADPRDPSLPDRVAAEARGWKPGPECCLIGQS